MIKFAKNNATPLNILTCPCHEAYETNLAKTGHNFYALRLPGTVKDWNTSFRSIPPNYGLLDYTKVTGNVTIREVVERQLPAGVRFDLVLSQNKFGQYQILAEAAKLLNLPLISLEHTLPVPGWPKHKLRQCQQQRGTVDVFISEFSRKAWGFPESLVVHHGIDVDLFTPAENFDSRNNHILAVANDYKNRAWCLGWDLWEPLTRGLPTKLVGDTPGISKAASSLEELAHFYRSSRIFLNTSTVSPFPTSLFEAMSAGCCVVSTSTCMIPEVIKHGENGLLFDPEKPEEGRRLLEEVSSDVGLAARLGEAARRTILEKFTVQHHVAAWNKVFYGVVNGINI